jgi:hypothetical protein
MGCLVDFSAHKRQFISSVTPEERIFNIQVERHRQGKWKLLNEFDAVLAELDRARQDPLLPQHVRTLCKDYREVIQGLSSPPVKEVIPPNVWRKLGA